MFPNVGVNGGDLFGVPVLVTEAAESKLIALDAAALFVADLGVELLESREASIEQVDNPTGNAAQNGAQYLPDFRRTRSRFAASAISGGTWPTPRPCSGARSPLAHRPTLMTTQELQSLAKGLAPALKQFVARELDKLRAELATRSGPTPRFKGVHRDGESYAIGDFVIRGGSTWAAVSDAGPHDVPGLHGEQEESGPWRLASMRGRPGKDASTAALEQRVRALEQRR